MRIELMLLPISIERSLFICNLINRASHEIFGNEPKLSFVSYLGLAADGPTDQPHFTISVSISVNHQRKAAFLQR